MEGMKEVYRIELDEEGYIAQLHALYLGPEDNEEGIDGLIVSLPEGFDKKNFWVYQYTENGEFVFDREKLKLHHAENFGIELRNKRDELLKSSDHFVMPDYPATTDERAEWTAYRQGLRDITKQPGWPEQVVWPEPPTA